MSKTCIEANNLRRVCSLQALYLCGDHDDCIDLSATEKIIQRATFNMKENILLTGVVEDLDPTLRILEFILPTYLENASMVASSLADDTDYNNRDFSSPKQRAAFASNVSPAYDKATLTVELEEICKLDLAVYKFAKELLLQRETTCR